MSAKSKKLDLLTSKPSWRCSMTFALRSLSKIWPIIIGIAIVLILNRLEQIFDPVVKPFIITSLEHTETDIIASGFLKKIRDCEFVGIIAKSGDLDVSLNFRDSKDQTKSRPVGYQTWGPWEMVIPKIAPIVVPSKNNSLDTKTEIELY